MTRQLLIFASGLIFAIGLGIAEMTRPEKVLGFLDIFGHWDPSLAFVMGGAIVVYTIALQIQKRLHQPVFDLKFRIPSRRDIDVKLLAGAATFGIGWGLAGFCPGPALVGAAATLTPALFFVPALLVGMVLHKFTLAR